ncbi:hypothetical protein ACCO45_010952 [Purpureocillium lilacinum]|uniref:Uncharacterized protein n=1 Tax=Purpureocillium lilacinum TaxID=33203 RepID=A0ACC4DHQ5_PURLI
MFENTAPETGASELAESGTTAQGRSTNDENSQPEKLYYTGRQTMILMRLEVDACGSMSVEKSDYPPPTLTRDEMEAINKMEWSCSREELARLPIFTDLEEAMLDNVRAKIKSDKEAEYAGIKRSVSYMEFDVREHAHHDLERIHLDKIEAAL